MNAPLSISDKLPVVTNPVSPPAMRTFTAKPSDHHHAVFDTSKQINGLFIFNTLFFK